MSPMRGGRIIAGMLIVTTIFSLVNSSAFSFQGTATSTPLSQRSAPTPPPSLGMATVVVTIALIDPSVNSVVADAKSRGLSELEIFGIATMQWLRITAAQAALVQVLMQSPYDAFLIDQYVMEQNSITVRMSADRVQLIQALPGVLAVRVGGSPSLPVVPTQELPPRHQIPPGTRLPPLEPPGYN